MRSLKRVRLFTIILFVSGNTIAQTTYESPHVKDSTTIQFTFPNDYYEVLNEDKRVIQAFTTEKNLTVEELGQAMLSKPVLLVMHLPVESNTIESILDKLKETFKNESNEMTILESPKISTINGREVALAAAEGKIDGEEVDGMYLSVMLSGDYYIMFIYKALEGVEKNLEYEQFREILESWREVATDKRDVSKTSFNFSYPQFDGYEDEVYPVEGNPDFSEVGPPQPPLRSPMKEPSSETGANIQFETQFEHLDVMVDLGEDWDLPLGQNNLLLSEFEHKETGGRVKVFSGGWAQNYRSDEKRIMAIKRVMGITGEITIEEQSNFGNDNHGFHEYSVTGGGSLTSFYITIVNHEMFFFLVDEGSNPVDDFKAAVHDFMLTVWVDMFRDE